MGKGARIREQSARERIAMQQAAARRAEVRRRGMFLGGTIVVVLAVVVALIVAFNLRNNNSPAAAKGGVHGTVLPASVSKDITSVPAATLDQIGGGSVPSFLNKTYSGSPIVPISDSALTSGGKPRDALHRRRVLPLLRRDALVDGGRAEPVRPLSTRCTASTPRAPTSTRAPDADLLQAGYTSKYLTFTPVENENINHNPLQNTTSAQQALWAKYDSSRTGSAIRSSTSATSPCSSADLRPGRAEGHDLGAGRAAPARPVQPGGPGHPRRGELHHGRHLQDDEQRAGERVHFVRRHQARVGRLARLARRRGPAAIGGRAPLLSPISRRNRLPGWVATR